MGIVLTPARRRTVVEAIEFVPMSGQRILCIVVSASGFVDSKVIDAEEPLS